MSLPAAQDNPVVLDAATSQAVLEHAAAVTGAAMPLAAGLRAAASEADSRRLKQALRGIASQLERGVPLDRCLTQSDVPPHLAGLIAAAQRTGDTGAVLAEWIEYRRAARERWRAVVAALTYPALALVIAMAVFLFISLVVVPSLGRMFKEFGMKLPVHTQMILWACNAGSKIMATFLVVSAAAAAALYLFGGRVNWSLLMTCLPIIGLPWHWTGVTEMLRVLGLLVDQGVPLPEALRLTAAGVSDAYVGSQCRILAARVERGSSLTMALIQIRSLPLSIAPLVYWGERNGLLADGLRSAADMIEGRLNFRTDMLLQIIPPVLLVFVALLMISIVVGLFSPLISLMYGFF